MANAFDNSANLGTFTAAIGTTANFAVSGPNPILHVGVATDTADNTDYVGTVTFNGIPMIRVDSFRSPGLGGLVAYELAGVSATAPVIVSLSASKTFYVVAHSLKGANQTGQPDATNGGANDPVTDLTVNTNTVKDNSWIVSFAGKKAGTTATISASTNVTSRQVNNFVAVGDSNGPVTPAGVFGQTWHLSASSGLAVIAISVSPSLVTAAGYKALTGVGQ